MDGTAQTGVTKTQLYESHYFSRSDNFDAVHHKITVNKYAIMQSETTMKICLNLIVRRRQQLLSLNGQQRSSYSHIQGRICKESIRLMLEFCREILSQQNLPNSLLYQSGRLLMYSVGGRPLLNHQNSSFSTMQ